MLGGCLGHEFLPGDRLGRYELLKVIGRGGFAAVWRARTVGPGGFERLAAIKVMQPARASLKRFQDMLLDEARLVARIQHPNVAQIWEVGEDPRSLYFVMELVDGASLDELRYRAEAEGKTLPIRAVFRVLADVCGGLHAAHELAQEGAPLGLVHRDVSPQNILVSRLGIGKLIDFGIAKAKERLAADTTTGFIKGKINYMAPEQARSEDLDRRADVWAIGAVAFDLVEGHPPFEGQTEVGRLAALVGPSPAPALHERVPAPLRAVVDRALQKDPNERFPTALALKEAIEEALIEAEMETSTDEAAALLAPYFSPAEGEAAAEVTVAERPISSTIAAPSPVTEVVQLPMNRGRSWPLLLVGLLGLGGALAALRAFLSPTSLPAVEAPSEAAAAPPPASPPLQTVALAPVSSASASAPASAASAPRAPSPPARTASPTTSRPAAPPVHGPSARPRTSHADDDDAIE
ncbi:serine/threonine-protein kinase [Polyangium sp. y55x31]|uniref:serine/threonine-protein kinase n=1 Tax=Polyangium sp. y55x31 TaxID=3042688 RepID=UPI002482762B|nr:serine/threonine-protein kinase [Polyangium sp. y55x31]MDI1476880.1 serine/threonine-protein kinase [Polyangium sp. y55x31]